MKNTHPSCCPKARACTLHRDQSGESARNDAEHRNEFTERPLSRSDVYRMIRRRADAIGLSTPVCCHSFRTTGITAYLENGGSLEHAQIIAAHESPRSTKLYDRTTDDITLDEIERIGI